MLDHGERACRWAVRARRIAIWLDFGSPNEGSGDRFRRRERPFCRSMSIFARSCSKCKKPWQDCSFVDIRACRHGLQIAPGRSWDAMLTRCCLRRGYERSPKGLWSCLGRLLARAGRSELAPAAVWAILGVSWAVPNESSERSKRSRRPKTTPRAILEPTWRQLGANLEPTTWSQLGANLDRFRNAQVACLLAQHSTA